MQAAEVDERSIVQRFQSKTGKSAELFMKAQLVIAGGVDAGIKFFEPYPVFMKRAAGSHTWDVDGNEYVDYLMSYGALILGHGDASVRDAIEATLRSVGTTVLGTPSEIELEFGAMLRDLYHPRGLIRFTNSGLEATLLAVRLARAFTGNHRIAKFEGHYHGAVDRLLFSYSPRIPEAGRAESPVPIGDSADVEGGILSDSVVLPFNDWDSTEEILAKWSRELACVIMEPFEEGVIPADQVFMDKLRKFTSELKIPLIFDEVKTGFRVRYGGASEYYGIIPDLTCLGKIIGGGLPIGAVVGHSEVMGMLDPRGPRLQKVFHSGTFNGNPLSLAVGKSTVEELGRKGRISTLFGRTESLKRGLSATLMAHGVPHQIMGEGAMFNIYMTDKKVRNYRDAKSSDTRLRRFIDIDMISRGIYLKPENRYCLSLAHTEEDVAVTTEKLAESLDAVVPKSN